MRYRLARAVLLDRRGHFLEAERDSGLLHLVEDFRELRLLGTLKEGPEVVLDVRDLNCGLFLLRGETLEVAAVRLDHFRLRLPEGLLEALIQGRRELSLLSCSVLESLDERRAVEIRKDFADVIHDGIEFIEELVFLRNVTLSVVEGEDVNGNGVLDPCEQDGDDTYPSDNGDDVLDLGARDLLTARGDGRINLNTAPVAVLKAIPGIREETAVAIDEWRRGPDAVAGTADDRVLNEPEELEQFEFLSAFELLMLRGVGSYASSEFRVFIRVTLPSRQKVFGSTVLLRREGTKIQEIAKFHTSDTGITVEAEFQ